MRDQTHPPVPAMPVLVSQHNSQAVVGLTAERFLAEVRNNPRLEGKVYRAGQLRLVALADLVKALQTDAVPTPEERAHSAAVKVLRAIGPTLVPPPRCA